MSARKIEQKETKGTKGGPVSAQGGARAARAERAQGRRDEIAAIGGNAQIACAGWALEVARLRDKCKENLSQPVPVPFDKVGEIAANLTLAVRHLEDAQGRVSRAMAMMEGVE